MILGNCPGTNITVLNIIGFSVLMLDYKVIKLKNQFLDNI